MKQNMQKQLELRIMNIFDKLILSPNMSEKQRNRQLTSLANHYNNILEYITEEEALKMISCFKNHPLYNKMLEKHKVLKDRGFDKALEV